ncbi:hypothetical protein [Streptomyces sp. NPDC093591]|uniref:hypothetical protein n=1 Tax=Streptomyces sp. NPDC093591 TaxID=3366044 RepID=UPI0037F9EA6D
MRRTDDNPGFCRHVGCQIVCSPDVADEIAGRLREAIGEILNDYTDDDARHASALSGNMMLSLGSLRAASSSSRTFQRFPARPWLTACSPRWVCTAA